MRGFLSPSRPCTRVAGFLLLVLLLLSSVPSAQGQPAGNAAASDPGYSIYLPVVARGYDGLTPPDPIELPGSLTPFGVQVWGLDDGLGIPQARQAGVSWLRAGLFWQWLEPENTTPDQYTWSAFDANLARLARSGMQPILVIGDNPAWAAETRCGPLKPGMLDEFAEFVEAVVTRYSRNPYDVRYWEIYNEPDCVDKVQLGQIIGGCWGNDSQAYAEMLRVAYGAVKKANPEAQVVLGGLAYDWFADEGGFFNRHFLDDVLREEKLGGSRIFDVMNFHYYPAYSWRWMSYGPDVIGKATAIRERMAYVGPLRPMILTEIGMWSGARYGGSEEGQSRYLPRAFARAMAADLRIIIWYSLLDDGTDFYWGLLRSDHTKRPSYLAYRVLTAELDQPRYLDALRGQPSAIEGYRFQTKGNREKVVVWSNEDGTYPVQFSASRLRVVTRYGEKATIADADDGHVDGRSTVSVGPDPLYVEIMK